MLEIHLIGCGYCHPEDFFVKREAGSGDYLFLIFKARTRVYLESGMATAEPGAVILYPPGVRQHYEAAQPGWENDYVHFGAAEHEDILVRLGLPEAEILYPRNVTLLMQKLSAIEEARIRNPDIADLYDDAGLRELLLLLHQSGEGQSGRHDERLRQVRLQVYRALAEPWSVKRMADMAHLSASYFFAQYRRLFGVSPMADLIAMRLELAKYYLENTALPLEAIYPLAGFQNEYHFIRQFKQDMGITPGRYARQFARNQRVSDYG